MAYNFFRRSTSRIMRKKPCRLRAPQRAHVFADNNVTFHDDVVGAGCLDTEQMRLEQYTCSSHGPQENQRAPSDRPHPHWCLCLGSAIRCPRTSQIRQTRSRCVPYLASQRPCRHTLAQAVSRVPQQMGQHEADHNEKYPVFFLVQAALK